MGRTPGMVPISRSRLSVLNDGWGLGAAVDAAGKRRAHHLWPYRFEGFGF